MPIRLDNRSSGFEDAFARFLIARREADADVRQVVEDIIREVREGGDAALIALTKKFDRHEITAAGLHITAEEIEQAFAACDPETLQALRTAAARIEDYHRRQLPEDLDYTDQAGVRLGVRKLI